MAYFDYNATTPILPSIKAKYLDWLDNFGNPSSLHAHGRAAELVLEGSRREILSTPGLETYKLAFTSGGTEANRLAFEFLYQKQTDRKKVFISVIEHSCILDQAPRLRTLGYDVNSIPVTNNGTVDLEWLNENLNDDVALVSAMFANNETGVIQPVEIIGRLCQQFGIHFHCDTVQAVGKTEIDWEKLNADTIAVCAHKIYGPKGVGALLYRKKPSALFVGTQENSVRGGTENIPGIDGFAQAWTHAHSVDLSVLLQTRIRLEEGIRHTLPQAVIFGENSSRLANTISLAIPGRPNDELVIALDRLGFSVSRGAACHSGVWSPSHVLLAMGVDKNLAECSIRISTGIDTKITDCDALVHALTEVAMPTIARV